MVDAERQRHEVVRERDSIAVGTHQLHATPAQERGQARCDDHVLHAVRIDHQRPPFSQEPALDDDERAASEIHLNDDSPAQAGDDRQHQDRTPHEDARDVVGIEDHHLDRSWRSDGGWACDALCEKGARRGRVHAARRGRGAVANVGPRPGPILDAVEERMLEEARRTDEAVERSEKGAAR
jgi:hypothetical protein